LLYSRVGQIPIPVSRLLRSLLSWRTPPAQMPSSQALLFWLKEAAPERFGELLARVREYEGHCEQAMTAR
jgi:hypothetical protein